MPIISSIRTSVENQQALVLDLHAKKGTFCRDARGRLLSFSGGFTVVYPYEVNSEKWAFRCWHTEMGNVRRRFEIIARAIQKSNAKYLCDFAYVDEGIIVDGKIYPTTRMRWVDGSKIKDYICQNKTNKVLLHQLAKNFLALVQDMHHHNLAHGDLQHGNIIVDPSGNLFLVDYDSFYCDELKGEPDIITGLKDYQHPLRHTNNVITEKVDYFSELIIYLSILGIAAKPELVDKYQVEDSEHMLFESNDFAHLRSSKIYQELHGISFNIDMLLIILEQYLSATSLDDLRPFDQVLDSMTKEPEIHVFTSSCGSKGIKGESVTLCWAVENYIQILLNGKDVTNQSSQTFTLSNSEHFVLEVRNGSKTTTKAIDIQAIDGPQILFSADKEKLHKDQNESVAITWDVQNFSDITLLQDGQIIQKICEAKKNYLSTPKKDTIFLLRVLALDKETIVEKQINIKVYADASIEFKSDKEYVFPSIPFTLSWDSQNAIDIELNGKKVEASGNKLIQNGIIKDTVYTLRVKDNFGIKEKSLTIKVLPIPRIESLTVPVPNIEKSIEVRINLNIPKINISIPRVDTARVDIAPPEIYDVNVETLKAPSPPKIDLMEKKKSWISRISWEKVFEEGLRMVLEENKRGVGRRRLQVFKSQKIRKNGK